MVTPLAPVVVMEVTVPEPTESGTQAVLVPVLERMYPAVPAEPEPSYSLFCKVASPVTSKSLHVIFPAPLV